MKVIEQMLESIPVPRMIKIQQKFEAPEISNISEAVHRTIQDSDGLQRISAGDRVAIAVGSRGIADMTTKQVYERIDPEKGYANALTSTVVKAVRVPMLLDTDELAVKAAIKTCGAFDLNQVRIIRIQDTLHLKYIWISESLLSEAQARSDIEILSKPQPLQPSDLRNAEGVCPVT